MASVEDTQFCFRCREMAVIDKTALKRLPQLLNEAATIVGKYQDTIKDSGDESYVIYNLKVSLREAAILIDTVPQD